MPRVATPDRRVKIIESEADLKALQTEYKLSSASTSGARPFLIKKDRFLSPIF